jgi:hypothetical protein
MTTIMNAGSGAVPASGEGWTNTYETAREKAIGWHKRLTHDDGMRDIVLLPDGDGRAAPDGRWVFTFRHQVTGKEIDLEVDGVDHMDAYAKERLFTPRTYWNGSSTAEPDLEDFAVRGFEMVKTFRVIE